MGKKDLNFTVFFILFLAVLFLCGQSAFAAEVTLNLDGGNGNIDVDDHGGFEAYNEVRWDGRSHTATTALAIFDAISQDIDNVWSEDYMGDPNDDREDAWANNQSGIQRYAVPVAGMPDCIGDVAAAPGGDPSIPASFMGANTGLTVEQFVFAGADAPFAIHVYKISNTTNDTKDIKVAHLNDFDVGSTNPNDDMGYDEPNRLVWEFESTNGGYIAGTALLDRRVSNWFLEECCTLTWGTYADQLGFFTDDPAFNGDKNSEPDDLEVDIATHVGILQPGQSASVVFVVAVAKGGNSAAALANLQATIAEAYACYDLIDGDADADGNAEWFVDYGNGPVPYGDNNGGDNWPCFIATAGYGSHMEPHVMTLRQFRDSYLLTNSIGTSFVTAYNKYSPPIAAYIAQHDGLQGAVRIGLAPLVGFSWIALHYGALAALAVLFSLLTLVTGMTFLVRRAGRAEN
jgi:hypothetical protein